MQEPALPSAAAPSWRSGLVLFVMALAIALPVPLSAPSDALPSTGPAVVPAAAIPAAEAAPAAPLAASAERDATAPAAAAHPVVAPRLAADETEVCGLGVVHVDEGDPLARRRIPDGVRALALQRLGLAMAASRDERLRAAERLLSARLAVAPGALAGAADSDSACRQAGALGLEETARFCVDDQARSQAELLEPAAAAIDQLARMATLSSDPQVYAFAFEACSPRGLNFHGREGNCQLVSAEEWARRAPDDAAPWLQLAAQALARGDTAAATAALGRAAEAKTIVANTGALMALATAALPEGMPLIEQTAVLAEFAGFDAGAAPAGLDVIDTACADPALADAQRRTLCDGLGRMLVERGRSSATVVAGVQLGERLGWPAERTRAILREHRDALDAAFRFTEAPQGLACDSLQRQRELALLTGRLGQLGAARELLRREGSDPSVPHRE